MKKRRALLEKGPKPGAVRITRRELLRIGGTGLAGAALLVRPSVENWVQHPTGSIELKYARVE